MGRVSLRPSKTARTETDFRPMHAGQHRADLVTVQSEAELVTRTTPAKVLFVAYGSGHIKMVVPLAQTMAADGPVEPVVLALTTAAPVARAAGLPVIQFKDFVTDRDCGALRLGERLLQGLGGPVADPQETVAYLGLSMADLIDNVGAEKAELAYRQFGRQAFLPVRTLHRILRQVAPDVVVCTNSPRAERAAVMAARQLGIPSICLVDLFAIDEVKWIGAPDYADRVCVLNESVRQFLVAAGRSAEQVVVTGNPSFDALNAPAALAQGRHIRVQRGWTSRRVILWPTQVEPAFHPFDGRSGDPTLPDRALAAVMQWVLSRADCVLCIRPRAGEAFPVFPADPRIVLTGQDWPLAPLLHAANLVVTLNSTIGLEGHLAGCRLIQVLGSVFDQAMPLARYGIADAAIPVEEIPRALEHWVAAPRLAMHLQAPATQQVLAVMDRFL